MGYIYKKRNGGGGELSMKEVSIHVKKDYVEQLCRTNKQTSNKRKILFLLLLIHVKNTQAQSSHHICRKQFHLFIHKPSLFNQQITANLPQSWLSRAQGDWLIAHIESGIVRVRVMPQYKAIPSAIMGEQEFSTFQRFGIQMSCQEKCLTT